MRILIGIVSVIGLCLTILPSIFVFNESMDWRTHTQLMFIGMVLWFIFAPFWMRDKKSGN